MLTQEEIASATHEKPLAVWGWCSGCMYAAYWYCCGKAYCKDCLFQHKQEVKRIEAAALDDHMQREVER